MNRPHSALQPVRARPIRPRAPRLAAVLAASLATAGLALTPAASAMQAPIRHIGAPPHGNSHTGAADGGGLHAMVHAHIAALLSAADATPQQTARIHQILGGAFEQMAPLHQRLAGSHAELHRILTAPQIDRAALERLRLERMADLDQASRVATQALADAAEVLTPEQRARMVAGAQRQHMGAP